MRAGDDDDRVEARQPLEHGGEQDALLGRAEPRRRTGGEDDACDHVATTLTFSITTG